MTGRPLEVAWFSALCDDDYEFLGVPDPDLASSFGHCADIVAAADRLGYDNVLLPSGYELGIDAVAFAAGVSRLVRRIRLLLAVRMGEVWLPQLARQLATLDAMLGPDPAGDGRGRLCVNIISSDLPGAPLPSDARYRRTLESMTVLRALLDGEEVSFSGEFVDLDVAPPRARTVDGRCPPLYFGGLSEPARDVAARAADVYLMWPETLAGATELVADLTRRAASHGRDLAFGFRCHVIVRETGSQAREAAARLISRLDPDEGERIRRRSLDTGSAGVARQVELRERADDDGFVEDHLWTGISRARSGAGAALVGDPDQVLGALLAYRRAGIDSFVLSGYPHLDEADRFAGLVLDELRRAVASPG